MIHMDSVPSTIHIKSCNVSERIMGIEGRWGLEDDINKYFNT